MRLTGHTSRTIFDRDPIIHEQELLKAELVASLARQAQAPRPSGRRIPRGQIRRSAPGERIVRRRSRGGRTQMAIFRIRPGLRKSDQKPNSRRSLAVRCGARWRRRCKMSSCCLSRRCSAITARTPPGPHSVAVMKRIGNSRRTGITVPSSGSRRRPGPTGPGHDPPVPPNSSRHSAHISHALRNYRLGRARSVSGSGARNRWLRTCGSWRMANTVSSRSNFPVTA